MARDRVAFALDVEMTHDPSVSDGHYLRRPVVPGPPEPTPVDADGMRYTFAADVAPFGHDVTP